MNVTCAESRNGRLSFQGGYNVRNQVECGRTGDGVSSRREAATCALLEVIIILMELVKGPMLFRIERRTSEKIALQEANQSRKSSSF